MVEKRREFLSNCAAAAAVAALGVRPSRAADKVPVLGLIFPPANRGVPEEGIAMYGDSLRFVVTGLGVETMTPDGFDSVIPRIPAAAEKLAAAGADAIELTGTSLTFYKGEAFNRKLRDAVTRRDLDLHFHPHDVLNRHAVQVHRVAPVRGRRGL